MSLFRRQSSETAPERYLPITDFDQCLQSSHQQMVFILKHSNTCPISGAAKSQVDRFLAEHDIPAYLIIVQQQRPLSREIAERLGIQHESPQLICLKNGVVSKVLNHYSITLDNLEPLLETNSAA